MSNATQIVSNLVRKAKSQSKIAVHYYKAYEVEGLSEAGICSEYTPEKVKVFITPAQGKLTPYSTPAVEFVITEANRQELRDLWVWAKKQGAETKVYG